MGKGKIIKFEALNSMPNVFQNFNFQNPHIRNSEGDFIDLKGRWHERYFNNNNPIVLELACGKGEYTVGLAEMFPEKNYIGFDLKGNRLFTGAKRALQKGLKNTAFFRTKIELLEHYFSPGEVNEIWITFSDPFLKKPNRRLTHPEFLDIYRKVCTPDATVNLKTDSPVLYEFTKKVIAAEKLETLQDVGDVYQNGKPEGPLGIQTHYEKMHLEDERTIRFLQFKLN